MTDKLHRKSLLAVTLGNGLEIYDFAVYSFFSVIIGHLFFPVGNATLSLLLSVATFGIGFLVRPLGSIVLGQYADRHGRKPALQLILLLMGLGGLFVAAAPTWQQVGIWGPVILIIGRLIQGFSAGGEIGTATSWLLEAGEGQSRGQRVSWQMVSQGAAALAGAIIGFVLTHSLSMQALYSWGWRVPFIIGLLIIPLGLIIRKTLPETQLTNASEVQATSSLGLLLKQHRRRLFLGILLVMKSTTSFYIIVYYLPAYMVNTLAYSPGDSYWLSIGAAVITLLAPLFLGRLIDRVAHLRGLMLSSLCVSTLLTFPIFLAIMHHLPLSITLSIVVVDQVMANLYAIAFFVLVLESFPSVLRASALSIIYAFGVTLFGGFAQFNVTFLLNISHNPLAPAAYLLFCGLISLAATYFWKSTPLPQGENIYVN
ncbi:MFS transporter [Rosenbergiella australiborealis]|uniref:MFS transporter n=1 Tax=Rosenbergiella australiborealis TaxID=1544696 RepID=A0ABS5T5F9_9GAMM|nr:MFS transporter [Rosenbergiella australiborealis]MBT0726677.1 MFS transporter [Rosenbergiella australiborealis]